MELEIPMIKQVYWEGNQCVDMLANVARNEEYEDFVVFGMLVLVLKSYWLRFLVISYPPTSVQALIYSVMHHFFYPQKQNKDKNQCCWFLPQKVALGKVVDFLSIQFVVIILILQNRTKRWKIKILITLKLKIQKTYTKQQHWSNKVLLWRTWGYLYLCITKQNSRSKVTNLAGLPTHLLKWSRPNAATTWFIN